MEEVPEELAHWAVGPGLAVIAGVAAALAAGEDLLAVGTRLRRDHPADRAAFATTAAATRLRAIDAGIPHANDLVLTREALEQASHPAAAAWRAHRAATAVTDASDGVVQDRCAGTGGDAVAIAAHVPVLAIEADPGRAVLAAHRAEVLGVPVEVRVGDALDPTHGCAGAVVHADPDRRDATGRRARTLAQHRPPIADLLGVTSDAAGRLLTVAPGVAWDDPDLPPDAEVVFLQHDGALLEAVLCTGVARRDGARSRAVLLDHGVEWHGAGPVTQHVRPGAISSHLLRPAAALVRARLHDELARSIGAWRVADRRALLTVDEAPDPSPWCSVERVLDVTALRAAAVAEALPSDARVEVVLHGVEVDVRAFLRDLGGPATGPDDVRIHLVRRDTDAVAVLTRAVVPHT